jgi:predicted ester cyclase
MPATDDLSAVVERMVAALNGHDVAAIRELSADSDEEWAPWERAFRDFFTAFPDYRISVQHSVLGDSSFALFYEVTATHSAEFPAAELKGIPASGKTLTWNEAVFQEVRDGKITNGHLVIDGLARLQQLGVVPATENQFPE